MAQSVEIRTPHVRAELISFARKTTREAKINLGAYQRRERLRTKWRKIGTNKWIPAGAPKVTYAMSRLVMSGALKSSLLYRPMVRMAVRISMLRYGQFIDEGVEGDWKGTGHWSPPLAMLDFVQSKPLRPRDLKTNMFIKSGSRQRERVAFLINRKIKWFGIEPSYFFSEPLKKNFDELGRNAVNAFIKDIHQSYTELQ